MTLNYNQHAATEAYEHKKGGEIGMGLSLSRGIGRQRHASPLDRSLPCGAQDVSSPAATSQ